MRGKFRGVLERDGVGQGGADPERAFVEVRQKFAADEGEKQERGSEDDGGDKQSGLGVIEAPLETSGVAVADPIENAVGLFLNTVLEPVGGENWEQR